VPVRLPSLENIPGGSAFAALSRRVRTLIIGGVLFVILFVVALTMPVPYVILSPGPTFNTLGVDDNGNKIIMIMGKKPNVTTGNLNMTTVNVSTHSVSAFEAFVGWLEHDEVVVPRSAVYPPNKSTKQIDQQNTADFAQSQDSATVAALCELKYPKQFGVFKVIDNGPSSGLLRAGDQLLAVAGQSVTSTTQLRAVLATHAPGTSVIVHIKRSGKILDVPVKLGTPQTTGVKGGFLGVSADNTCLAPFNIDLGLGNEIGGPSAGLMFALGIIDEVGTVDLTGGKFIAGTGTIDNTGKVGPIGGIALKMIAARNKGATIFLAPQGNCDDVRGNVPSGLRVISVSTLHEAVTDLEGIQNGTLNPAGC